MGIPYVAPANLSALHIMGLGAVGSLICAGAQHNSIPYQVITRQNRNDLAKVGLSQHRVSRIEFEPVTLSNATLSSGQLLATDLVILPLKVYQLREALLALKPRLCAQTPIVLLHNGMGGFEITRAILPTQPLLLATTSHGAMKIEHQHIKHTGLGSTVVGPAPDMEITKEHHYLSIVQCLNKVLPPLQWCEDMLPKLWLKLSVNAVINPLTAIHNVNNGALLTEQFQPSVEAITREVHRVMQAEGINYQYGYLVDNVRHVMQATSANFSSMHQDVYHRRTTEIDSINGYICQRAQYHSRSLAQPIITPHNQALIDQIKVLSP